MQHIVLASSSPRRQELLRQIGLVFDTEHPSIPESIHGAIPKDAVLELSVRKAKAVASRHPEAIVIAADTIGVLDGLVLAKPRSDAHAAQMLATMSGRSHAVLTGFTVISSSPERKVSMCVTTIVKFRHLANAEIEAYVKTGESIGKAGAYAIQGLGALLVEGIEGDYYNVVGLPLSALSLVLKDFGVVLLG